LTSKTLLFLFIIEAQDPIYTFKNYEGLKKYGKILKWNKDIGQTIENLFFQHHYPCSSFVIINNKGEYFSSFGEFGKEYVWKVLKKMQ